MILKDTLKKSKPDKGYIITHEDEDLFKIDGHMVRVVPAHKRFLQKKI